MAMGLKLGLKIGRPLLGRQHHLSWTNPDWSEGTEIEDHFDFSLFRADILIMSQKHVKKINEFTQLQEVRPIDLQNRSRAHNYS